jgi:hypothetical protein
MVAEPAEWKMKAHLTRGLLFDYEVIAWSVVPPLILSVQLSCVSGYRKRWHRCWEDTKPCGDFELPFGKLDQLPPRQSKWRHPIRAGPEVAQPVENKTKQNTNTKSKNG